MTEKCSSNNNILYYMQPTRQKMRQNLKVSIEISKIVSTSILRTMIYIQNSKFYVLRIQHSKFKLQRAKSENTGMILHSVYFNFFQISSIISQDIFATYDKYFRTSQ